MGKTKISYFNFSLEGESTLTEISTFETPEEAWRAED
jgi:hypothetical protein